MEIEALYHEYKTPLFSLAYRMLGSVMDAEDVVQDAFLSYDQLPDRSAIRNERAYLYKIVTNRCLDLLRSSARKRELYVGPWLPEPLIDNGSIDPSDEYLQRESISTAYLLLLQQLGAVERRCSCCAKFSIIRSAKFRRSSAKAASTAAKFSIAPGTAFISIPPNIRRSRSPRKRSRRS
nr:sigma factor [Paenibacillus sp. 32O-W]